MKWGDRAPLAPPLATAMPLSLFAEYNSGATSPATEQK